MPRAFRDRVPRGKAGVGRGSGRAELRTRSEARDGGAVGDLHGAGGEHVAAGLGTRDSGRRGGGHVQRDHELRGGVSRGAQVGDRGDRLAGNRRGVRHGRPGSAADEQAPGQADDGGHDSSTVPHGFLLAPDG